MVLDSVSPLKRTGSPVSGSNCVCVDGPSLRERVSVAEPSICGSIAARACTAPSRVARACASVVENCGSFSRASW